MATAIDAKGDLVAGTGADAFARLAVGTNGQVLTAASGEATGLQWTTISPSPTSGQNRVDTNQTTTSTSYTGLATAQSVTVTTGTKVLVIVSGYIFPQGSGNAGYISYAISGATTTAVSDTWALVTEIDSNNDVDQMGASYVSYQTVTAGSNTFTLQFKTNGGGTTNFKNRQIIVIDLGS
jgi:hypothetical protein